MSLTISKDKKQENYKEWSFKNVSCSLSLGKSTSSFSGPETKTMRVELKSIHLTICVLDKEGKEKNYGIDFNEKPIMIVIKTTSEFNYNEKGKNIQYEDLEDSEIKTIIIKHEDFKLHYEKGEYLIYEGFFEEIKAKLEIDFKNKIVTVKTL